MFGFSKKYYLAIISRALYGFLNGNLGVAKTYIREITDKTNQARAFSFIGVAYSVGVIFGPIIGGFFSRPSLKVPILFNYWFFITFPYALPNIIIACFSAIGAIFGIFFLKETNKKTQSLKFYKFSFKSIYNFFKSSPILKKKEPLMSCVIYSILGLADTMFLEVFPIWLWTPVANKGLGFEPYQIGILNMSLGFFIFASQIFFTPWINKKMGIKYAFLVTTIISIPPNFLFADLYRVRTSWELWILLSFVYFWRTVFIEASFTSSIMMINNSVEPSSLGSLNGIAQAGVAFTRTFAPTLGASLFALSISVDFIFDVHFCFFFVGCLQILLIPLAFCLKNEINTPK